MKSNLTKIGIVVIIAAAAVSLFTAKKALEKYTSVSESSQTWIPDEATKKQALMMAYALNENSMIRVGSLDLSMFFDQVEANRQATKGH